VVSAVVAESLGSWRRLAKLHTGERLALMDKLLESVTQSPELFPHTFDVRSDHLTFIRLTRTDYENASFLDTRILTPKPLAAQFHGIWWPNRSTRRNSGALPLHLSHRPRRLDVALTPSRAHHGICIARTHGIAHFREPTSHVQRLAILMTGSPAF